MKYTAVILAAAVFFLPLEAFAEYDGDFTIENGVLKRYVGDDAEIRVPSGVTEIGYGAFRYKSVQSITLPKTVERIGKNAFLGCSQLEEVDGGAEYIEESAFSGCSALCTVDGDYLAVEIGTKAFLGCGKLSEFSFGDELTSIGSYAFSKSGLKSVNLPDSLTDFGSGVFSNCTKLANIRLGAGLSQISESAFASTAIESVSVPYNVERIGYGAFSGCTALARVYMETGVAQIAKKAFMNDSALYKLELPESLEEIGDYAFYGCDKLENYTVPAQTTVYEHSFPQREEETEIPTYFIGNIRLSDGTVVWGNGT